jgi:SAM-dependent methyltransferase
VEADRWSEKNNSSSVVEIRVVGNETSVQRERLEALDAQYRRQAVWFYGVRANLLRRVAIEGKQRVLDLGCGTGAVIEELARRCKGQVVGLDIEALPLNLHPERFASAQRVFASGGALPFPNASFDLVFSQMLFLWVPDPAALVREVARVLQPGCELVAAAEPDFGGRIEYPEASRLGPRMSASLRALGADPEIARKLPEVFSHAGFHVDMGVHPSLFQPDELSAAWEEERKFLASVEDRAVEKCPAATFLFMPYFWFLARKQQ